MKSLEKPDFSDANYSVVADLLRYTDAWDTFRVRCKGSPTISRRTNGASTRLKVFMGEWTDPASHRHHEGRVKTGP